LVILVETEGLSLGLPLKVHGVCDIRAELVLVSTEDLLREADSVKLVDKLADPDELCVLIAVREIDAETDTDFDPATVGEWVIDPELLFDLRAVMLAIEPVLDFVTNGEALEVRVRSVVMEADLDILAEELILADPDDETIADPE
jgi:hypothetical protein